MRRCFKLELMAVFLALIFGTKAVLGKSDLIDLIPGLYGGDGITLSENEDNPQFSHHAHFRDDALKKLGELGQSISDISFPFPASQGGFTFEFDPILNEFVQSTGSLGPILADRAETIGKGKFNLGTSYTYVSYREFEGDELDDIQIALNHELDPGEGLTDTFFPQNAPIGQRYFFKKDVIAVDVDIDIESHIFSLFGNYGVTDKLDLGFLIPVIRNELKVKTRARVVEDSSIEDANLESGIFHQFDPVNQDPQNDSAEENDIGIGDILLRTKYNFLDTHILRMAMAIEVRLPTGDKDNLRGIDDFGIKPVLILSSTISQGKGVFNPHLNIGFDVNAGQDGQEEFDFAVGFDYGQKFGEDLITAAIDVIGSSEVNKKDDVGDEIFDLAVGIKWNLHNQNVLYGNLQFPLNEDGLRADVIYTLGYEFTF